MDTARSQLAPAEARAFLGLPEGFVAPDEEALERDARLLVLETLKLDQELAHLSPQGLQLSPIWDRRGELVEVRLAVLPPAFRSRYFAGEAAREALEGGELLRLASELVGWMVDDPVGGTFALEDTHRMWLDAEAPRRALGVRARDHFKLLSLLIADGVRKADADFTTLEWLASLGLPIEEWREADDPPAAEIRAGAQERTTSMRAEEKAWLRRAFERR